MVIRKIERKDYESVMAIYSYYILNTMAAYLEHVPKIDVLLNGVYEDGFLVIEMDNKVVGFGKIKKYHPSDVFKKTALVGYFLDASYVGKGLGKALLKELENAAQNNGITHLLAHVSSVNDTSQKFHVKNGFIKCGCFPQMGIKHGKLFDLLWYSKKTS